MNRDIEFRIWADNQFYYKCLVGNTNNIEDNNWTCPMVWLENKKEWVHCDNGIIQQYAGIKDKNGKKIFEGDIIRLDDDNRKLISSANAKTEEDLVRKDCLVGFKEGSFMFCRSRYFIDEFDSYLWLAEKHCEVIGNIYENKELLK